MDTIRDVLAPEYGEPAMLSTAELLPREAARLEPRALYWSPTEIRKRIKPWIDPFSILVVQATTSRPVGAAAVLRAFCTRRPSHVPQGNREKTIVLVVGQGGQLAAIVAHTYASVESGDPESIKVALRNALITMRCSED